MYSNTDDARSSRCERIPGLARNLCTEPVRLVSAGAVEAVVIGPRALVPGARRREGAPLAAHPDLDLDDLSVLGNAPGTDAAVEAHRLAIDPAAVVGPHRGLRAHVQVEV